MEIERPRTKKKKKTSTREVATKEQEQENVITDAVEEEARTVEEETLKEEGNDSEHHQQGSALTPPSNDILPQTLEPSGQINIQPTEPSIQSPNVITEISEGVPNIQSENTEAANVKETVQDRTQSPQPDVLAREPALVLMGEPSALEGVVADGVFPEAGTVQQDSTVSDRIAAVAEVSPVVVTTVQPSAPVLAPVQTTALYPTLQEEVRPEDVLQPWREEELSRLYQNPQLNALEKFVDNFIRQAKRENHEFYELLVSYLKARLALAVAQKQLEGYQSEYAELNSKVWSIENHTVTSQGKCADRSNVSSSYSYNVAIFNQENFNGLSSKVSAIKKAIKEDLCMHSYTCQVAKLHIEHYVYSLLTSTDLLSELPSNAPVACHVCQHDPAQLSLETAGLKDCVSVLFTFQRRPSRDQQFSKDCLQWLEMLLSGLLRVATLSDHQFILHHLLRCPPGVAEWAGQYVQVPGPTSPEPTAQRHSTDWNPYGFGVGMGMHKDWGGPLLDHFVTQLASLILPVRGREDFLAALGVTNPMGRQESTASETENWQFVTEALDCEREDDQILLEEADLIAFYDQFSFNSMFRSILNISPSDEYSVERVSPDGMLRLLAFCTCLVRLLGSAFTTFRKARYREFVKRIGRTIRHTVHYISDHWLNFSNYLDTNPNKMAAVAHMVPRLQVEYDEFVVRSAGWLLSAHKLGAWQFLADLPYSLLSMKVLLRIFFMLYSSQSEGSSSQQQQQQQQQQPPLTVQELEALLKESHLHSQFIDQLMTTLTSETVFLLTSFSNMARCRPWQEEGGEEVGFIRLIACHLFEITQVSDFSREVYFKTGASLLETIATVHPRIVSDLLHRAKVTVGSAQETHIDLFKELPVHLWRPSPEDTAVLREWLVSYPLGSAENQISRTVLISLNWSFYNPTAQVELSLEPRYHREVAVLLVEALSTHLPGQPGGLEFDIAMAESTGKKGLIQTLQFWNASLTKDQECFQSWVWKVVLMLKLHPSQLDPQQYAARESWMEATHKGLRWAELSKEVDLVDVHRAVRAGGLVASYVGLCTSLLGVDFDHFQGEGLPLFQRLVEGGYFVPALRVLSNIFPHLIKNSKILIHDERFVKIVYMMVTADSANASMFNFSRPDTVVLRSVVSMMEYHYDLSRTKEVIDFWFVMLTAQPSWFREPSILHILNVLSKDTIRTPSLHKYLQAKYIQLYKDKEPFEVKKAGLFSALSNFTGKGTIPFTFTSQYDNTEYPWLTFDILWAETEHEQDLWLELIKTLHFGKKASLDAAMRKACEGIGIQLCPLYHLAIFRWAQFCLSLPLECPLLPLVWQKFFNLYLHRVPLDRGHPLRESYGFKILSYQSDLRRKLKIHLQTLLKFSKETLHDLTAPRAEDEAEPGENDEFARALFIKIAELYCSVKFWVEEPLLHEADVVLSALPTNFDVPRLQEIFEPTVSHLWLEYLPVKRLEEESTKLVQNWIKVQAIQRTLSSVPEKSPVSCDSAVTRILNRLKKASSIVPAPALLPVQNPLPAVPPACLQSTLQIEVHLREDLAFVQNQARTFCFKFSRKETVDSEFLHLLPQLHKNVSKQYHVSQPCSKKASNHFCSGPATIIFKFDELVTDVAVEAQLMQNRAMHLETERELLVPVPYQLCCIVVSIEQIVAELSKIIETGLPDQRNKALDTSVGLFYLLTQHITKDIRRYLPTYQFFTSALSVLGQQFLPKMPNQSLQVLQLIRDSPHLSDLLVPLYDPNLALDHFAGQYQQIVDEGIDQKKLPFIFSLITKFSITEWLAKTTPDLSTCREVLKSSFRGMCFCGVEMEENEVEMLFEVYRKHFTLVVRHNVPGLLPAALDLMLEGMDSATIFPHLWTDLVNLARTGGQGDRLPQTRLSLQEIQNPVRVLSSHFSSKQSAVEQLYSSFGQYCQPLAELMSFLVLALLRRWMELVEQDVSHTDNAMPDVWGACVALFGPWILPVAPPPDTPTSPSQPKAYPWLHDQVDSAHQMMSCFVSTLSSLPLGLPGDRIIALVWQFYFQYVAIGNQSLFVIEVYHSEFAHLPWQLFVPEILDLENMISLRGNSEQPLLFSFCCYIAAKIDWHMVMSVYSVSQSEGSSGDMMTELHRLVLQMAIMMSQDANVMGEVSSIPEVFDRVGGLQWSNLDAKSMKQPIDWLTANCSPKDVLMKGSPLSLALSLLKEAAEFPSEVEKMKHPEFLQKRGLYIRHCSEIMSSCTHQKSISKQEISSPISDMFLTVLTLSLYENGSENSTIQLLEDILNLLNTASPNEDNLKKIITTFQDILSQAPNMHLIALQTLRAAVRTIVAVDHMAEVVETCIEVWFAAKPGVEQPDQEWANVCTTMAVPEDIVNHFKNECVRKNLYLSLFGMCLIEMSSIEAPRQELDLMVKLSQWSTRMKPEATDESKALLLWWKSLQLILRQVRYVGKVVAVVPYVTELAQALCRFGEDKASEGLLGVIGLGKRSIYSVQLRLLARGMGCFLHCQLPHDKEHKTQLRMTPNAPGAVRRDSNLPNCQPTKVAEQNFKSLQLLASNKTYLALKDQISFMVDFINEPEHNVMSSLDLFVYLSQALFPAESTSFLSVLTNKI